MGKIPISYCTVLCSVLTTPLPYRPARTTGESSLWLQAFGHQTTFVRTVRHPAKLTVLHPRSPLLFILQRVVRASLLCGSVTEGVEPGVRSLARSEGGDRLASSRSFPVLSFSSLSLRFSGADLSGRITRLDWDGGQIQKAEGEGEGEGEGWDEGPRRGRKDTGRRHAEMLSLAIGRGGGKRG